MLKFHDESKPSLFDYVLRVTINEKANLTDDDDEPPYITEILFPTSDQDIKLPKTFLGIGLFFFSDVSDKYLKKGHPKFVSQWPDYSTFSFCLTDEKKNIYFVFAYSNANTVHCVISDYYHPEFMSDFVYKLSTHKNPSKFANKINNIFINSANKQEDEQNFQDGEVIFLHDQYDWFFKIFQSENSNSESTSGISLPMQGPKSVSSTNMSRNQTKIQLLSTKKTSNLSISKMSLATKSNELTKALSGISHINHMSPDNELAELYKFIFSNLPVEYILILINAILLDFKIIIISKDVAKLGRAAFAIIGLIYPLKWPGSFIPICPEPMSTILEAPFPYIIGIHSSLSMKLLEGDNMFYCVYNVDGHYLANIGIEDFPPKISEFIDLAAEKIKALIHSYSPLFPFVHLQREIRNFIKGTLANSYGLDPDDFGYKALMADFVVWRDESSSEYAAYFSQSQTVDNFMRSLENSEYEKDDRVFKAFFPNETFMGTVHIPRQLVEESIEKEREDGITINFEDLQMKSKLYGKTSLIKANGRNITFDSNSDTNSNTNKDTTKTKTNEDDSSDRNSSEKETKSRNDNSNVSDSESGVTITKRKHKHKHKHKTKSKTQRASMPIPPHSEMKDNEVKELPHSHYPGIGKSSDEDSDLSADNSVDIEKIINREGQKNNKKSKDFRHSAHIGKISTFSGSTSDTDQSVSVSDSDDTNSKQTKTKRRVPPDLPAIPNKKSRSSSQATPRDEIAKSGSSKSDKKKSSREKTKSKPEKPIKMPVIENDSDSDEETDSENETTLKKKQTVLFIESDSDVEMSFSSDNSDDDDENWSSSSSEKNVKKENSKTPQKRTTNERDLNRSSSSSSEDDRKQFNKNEKIANTDGKRKKKKRYNFNSDATQSDSDDDDENDELSDEDIKKRQKESIRKMARKSNFSNDEDVEVKKKRKSNFTDSDKSDSMGDSPIPKKNQKYLQANDLIHSPTRRKAQVRPKPRTSFTSDNDNFNDSDNSEDSNDSSLKRKYKKSSNSKQPESRTKNSRKRKAKNRFDSDPVDSSNSDESD